MESAAIEFRQYSFNESSISHIIARAQIPRGSFYQYFEDKADLYMYYTKKIGLDYNEYLLKLLEDNKGDYFKTLRLFIKDILNEVFVGENAVFYARMMEAHDFELFRKYKHRDENGNHPHDDLFNEKIFAKVDLKSLKIDSYDEFKMLNMMLLSGGIFRTVSSGLMMQKAQGHVNLQELEANYNKMIDWLQYGVAK